MMGSGDVWALSPQAVCCHVREYGPCRNRARWRPPANSDSRCCWHGWLPPPSRPSTHSESLIPSAPGRPSCPVFIPSLSRCRRSPRLGTGPHGEHDRSLPCTLELRVSSGKQARAGLCQEKQKVPREQQRRASGPAALLRVHRDGDLTASVSDRGRLTLPTCPQDPLLSSPLDGGGNGGSEVSMT